MEPIFPSIFAHVLKYVLHIFFTTFSKKVETHFGTHFEIRVAQEGQDEPILAKQSPAVSAGRCGRCSEEVCGALKSRKKPITTTKIEQSSAGPLQALRAEGTVADTNKKLLYYKFQKNNSR